MRGRTVIRHGRGQVSLFGLIAIALVVLIIASYVLRGTSTERTVRAEAVKTRATVDRLRDLSDVIESALRDSVEESVYELGRRGGYTTNSLPGPVVAKRPIYLQKGRMVLFPTVQVMEGLLSQEATRRLAPRLEAIRAGEKAQVVFGAPRVTATLQEEDVEATLELTYHLESDDEATRSIEDMTITLPLRLRILWSRAKAYLEMYEKERHMERNLLSGMINDDRIPSPPGGLGETMACREQRIIATKRDMAEPFTENAQLSVAKELQRQRSAAKDEPDIEWSMELVRERVDMTLLANPGTEQESTKHVEYVPVPFPFIDRRDADEPVCLSRYNVSYTAQFDVMMVLRDLRPVAMGVRTEGRPLEFTFVLEPYLTGVDPYARFGQEHPVTVEDLCGTGGCELELTVTGPGNAPVDGQAWLDTCLHPFDGGRLERTKVPCGEHTLVVESRSPPGLGRLIERVDVSGHLTKDVELGTKGRVHGRVYVKDRISCTGDRRTKAVGERTLTYVDGVPPRAVRLHMVPLDGYPGSIVTVVADEEGTYEFPEVDGGTYLLLAHATTDTADRPAYKVRSRGLVVRVRGDTEVPVEMYPLIPVHTSRGYEYVTRIEAC